MTIGFIEFEFDLPDALLASLIKVFDQMSAAALMPANVDSLPEAQGVYQLLLGDEIVYIGKTDAEAGLRRRLQRHAWTIQHRQNLNSSDVSFKAVRVFVFTAIDLETQLIRHYGSSRPVPWNNSGFGSNDPGRNRDTTDLKPEGFDARYPIDLDHTVKLELPTHISVHSVLTALRASLPYTLRIEGGRRGHADFTAATSPALPPLPLTTRLVINAVLKALPAGWQATALAGRIILYRENREYAFGTVIGRSPNT